jgi:tetratricopeptide (TPR) repeat protein
MLQRGRAQLAAGLEALAIESFRAEIRFNPDNMDAYNGLAVAYGRIGRNDLAQRYFEIALAKDPLNVKVQANLHKLQGNDRFEVQQAVAAHIIPAQEPVTVTASNLNQLSVYVEDVPRIATLAAAQIKSAALSDTEMPEILPKRGILSARFAMASADAAMGKADKNVASQAVMPIPPVKPPVRPSERPIPYLHPDIRAGARLERVSLNEVRLITLATHLPQGQQPKQSFDSFGDRIALWLPAYMTAEQAASRYQGDENIVIMAAVERATSQKKAAVAPRVHQTKLPVFAYIFFADSTGSVGS